MMTYGVNSSDHIVYTFEHVTPNKYNCPSNNIELENSFSLPQLGDKYPGETR